MPQVFSVTDAEYDITSLLSRTKIMDEVKFQNDPQWYLLGTGFDSVNLSPNAQTISRRYVNEDTDSVFTVGYGVVVDFTLDEMNRPVIKKLLNIARRRYTGNETIIRHRRTYLQLEYEHKGTGYIVSDQHQSFEQWVNVVISNESPRDNVLSASGQLTYVTGFVWGGYDPVTRTFTPEQDMPLGVVPVASMMFTVPDTFDAMTIAQLETYAEQKGVDLEGATKKADIIETLRSKPL